jgi:hypothetical protein
LSCPCSGDAWRRASGQFFAGQHDTGAKNLFAKRWDFDIINTIGIKEAAKWKKI